MEQEWTNSWVVCIHASWNSGNFKVEPIDDHTAARLLDWQNHNYNYVDIVNDEAWL